MQAAVFDSPGKVRRILEDRLFSIRPGVYWLDFGLSISVAWGAFFGALNLKGVLTFPVLALSILAFYRSLFFVHEIVHFRQGKLSLFRWTWNILCGAAFFLPDFTYIIHSAHHLTSTFSTEEDPEYIPLAYQRPVQILALFLFFPLVPLAMMLRFLVAAPISWLLGGGFRDWLLRSASSL